MDKYDIKSLTIPAPLTEIPDPPKQLFIRGTYPKGTELKFLTVVGARKYTPYGKQVCEHLIHELKGYPVVIISGLALGIDGVAHRAALDAGLTTIAVPGSGLSDTVLYPRTHLQLAHDILEHNGALISEFEPDWKPRPESFPQRNRIMAGMSDAVLVVEAELRSGTLITSRLATEYNRDVLAIPGPVHSETSKGPHMLIQKGAALITSGTDILETLGIDAKKEKNSNLEIMLSLKEQRVKDFLTHPLQRDELIQKLSLPVSEANILLSGLELKGYLREVLGSIEWIQ